MLKLIVQLAVMPLPWWIRQRVLNWLFRFKIHPTARIQWSLILARRVCLGAGAHIGSFNLIKGLDELVIEEGGRLGRLNWITGTPRGSSKFFADQPERHSALIIRSNAVITHRHLIDCSDLVEVGSLTTIGGWGSQILTHSIDISTCRQRAAPVRVGRGCFVGTRVILLKGSVLPDFSILGAGSVLAAAHDSQFRLYSGVPAVSVKELDPELPYFNRTTVGVY